MQNVETTSREGADLFESHRGVDGCKIVHRFRRSGKRADDFCVSGDWLNEATGYTREVILKLYPYLEEETITQALKYAAWYAEEIELPHQPA